MTKIEKLQEKFTAVWRELETVADSGPTPLQYGYLQPGDKIVDVLFYSGKHKKSAPKEHVKIWAKISRLAPRVLWVRRQKKEFFLVEELYR